MSTYGCRDRPPLRESHAAQDGWYQDGHTRTPRMVPVHDPMTKSCQYAKDDKYADPGCIGCSHKQPNERKS